MRIRHNLLGGPLDGGKVRAGPKQEFPMTIFTLKRPNDDRYQPWSREASLKYCCCYMANEDGTFDFMGYVMAEEEE